MAESRRACASCGTTNEEDARFCEGCGASLARVCATCGLGAKATARFCRGCGTPLEGQAAVAADVPVAGPARKTVTVMFADLAGSTTFEEQVDAETARDVIGRYHDLLRSTAQRHQAGTTKYIGDGFMAVWGVPEIGPEDAVSAVDAAVELQERFVDLAAQVAKAHGTELALRVAVNTGEVVVGAGDADLVGDALNVGARLEAECPRGQIVVGEETWRATRSRYGYESLGRVQVKGRSAPVAVYQWLGLQPDAADAAPFVGRSQEVRRLQRLLDDAIAARAARLMTVIGDPGVGKSRLAAEFIAAQTNTHVIQSRCAVDGAVALAPIVEMLRARDLETDIPAEVSERDRLLRDLHGLATGVPGSVEENFWALRRFIEVLAGSGRVVFVLDDIQWADSLLLDFIEHLVEWIKEVPVLVLALARPELREIRPDLVAASRWVADTIHLDGLDAGATAELAAKVLGATELPAELLHRLPSSTGGNPLFVREFVGMLAHDGVLVEQPTGWELTIDVDAITIPPTIHALLASRLERLDPVDRRVLEIASVVGSDFSVDMVRALAGGQADAIKVSLNRLRRLELAQPTGTYVGDEAVWGFHHVLIRDVAYRRLLKSDRAELHERLADWIEAGGPSVAFEADEMIARHLEAAHTYRRELGEFTEHTNDLALLAARHYSTSARRSLDRDELISAGTQAARGADLAAADDAVRAELLLTGCEAFLSAGDVVAGAGLVDELERIAGEGLAPWATCYRCQFGVYTDPERLLDYDSRLQGAIDEFAHRADPAGLAKAHRVRASARLRLGRVGDGELDLFEALIAARQSGDHRQITAALGAAPGAALWGPSPVPKAGGRCLDVVRMQRMTTAAPSLEATSLRHLAVLELLRGRPDKARKMLGEARQIVADLGLRHGLMETELFAGIIELMSGDPVAAEPHFRTALQGLDALGVGADAGQAAALLARSVLAQGRIEEADQYAAESERLAGHNLKTAIAWRAVRAEILSARGQHDQAVATAQDAVAVAGGTDIVLDHAEACLALSRVLDAAGNISGADAARCEAQALYTAKEVATSVGHASTPAISPPKEPTRTGLPDAEKQPPTTSRLAVTNESCAYLPAFIRATEARDVEGALDWFSEGFVYDDRRRLSGDPVVGIDAMRTAVTRVSEQFTHFEHRVLAVRGERLHLLWSRWTDDHGNMSIALYVNETGADGRIEYRIRFDEDDFDNAYRELERRYYTGEGAEFAEAGAVTTEWIAALNQHDYDRLIGELTSPSYRLANRSSSVFGHRTATDVRRSFEDFDAAVRSSRSWEAAVCWLSPTVAIFHFEREATDRDGEPYSWTWLDVCEIRGGRVASACRFDLDDEDAAFAYAEERVGAATSRLRISNRASEEAELGWRALLAGDFGGGVARSSDQLVYDDRRQLSGDPIEGLAELRAASRRIFEQYPYCEWRTLAVRGERLELRSSRWWDDAGNEMGGLHLQEVDDDGLTVYHGRFDEDDFESAYRELERRYYAGEGAAFAEAGAISAEYSIALDHGDFDRVFGELFAADMRVENRSSSPFPDRTLENLRASYEDLHSRVLSSRTWFSVVHWLSPNCAVVRFEREAIGQDQESYSWTWLHVTEWHAGRVVLICRFDLEDEDAAFAYAEERVRATTSRLAVTNRASERVDNAWRQGTAGHVDSAMALFSDRFRYDDRRRLSGNPFQGPSGLRAAAARINEQYPHSEWRTLAVRGDRLELRWSRWWDDAGNETVSLNVHEVDDEWRVVYHGRFDEDDFEGAYRELGRRYWAAEGAAIAESASLVDEFMRATDKGDFDLAFGQLASPELRAHNKSSSAFADRSAGDLRASLEQLSSMVASNRSWIAVERYLSPEVGVVRHEREGIGHDGELYSWTRILVGEVRDGRIRSMCQFELYDEAAAFAHAEELLDASASRLAVTNRASRIWHSVRAAMEAGDADRAAASFADSYVYDDRWAMAGSPPVDVRTACEEILAQYSIFEGETLAVRGDSLQLSRTRWADDAGFETQYLHVIEIDEDGLVCYYGRFGDDDFESAYREFERRYCIGEGAAVAEAETTLAAYPLGFMNGDINGVFDRLAAEEFRLVDRSRSVFGDRSVADFRATYDELFAMASSLRVWHGAACWLSPAVVVARFEQTVVGPDDERYAWTHIDVAEIQGGKFLSVSLFEIDDEDAAFAYADELVHATASGLSLTNRATKTFDSQWKTLQARDIDAATALFAYPLVYDDRRRLQGNPLGDTRTALERLLNDYTSFEGRTLAVRGESLHLGLVRWSNEDGFEACYLMVQEVDDVGRIVYHGRFDEDDFESAYRELTRRYCAGEGAAVAAGTAHTAEFLMALNQRNWDRVFGELTDPDMHALSRSSSGFPDRSAAELRASYEDLCAMVAWVRSWHSAEHWVSPTVAVTRHEREAMGRDGERYAWTRLIVGEFRDGRATHMCEFDVDDEAAAFAYAEERVRRAENR
ncbi:AAA family ATPase [Mycobacterium neumannii]|uniref:AAA family ATPase n=1 Tax=Mycobacterium neumannii TaxID=2048551 RepID=UPI003AB2B808